MKKKHHNGRWKLYREYRSKGWNFSKIARKFRVSYQAVSKAI